MKKLTKQLDKLPECEFKELPDKPIKNQHCTNCDFWADAFDVVERWNFCPNCGAKIKWVRNES